MILVHQNRIAKQGQNKKITVYSAHPPGFLSIFRKNIYIKNMFYIFHISHFTFCYTLIHTVGKTFVYQLLNKG
jgi:hypothetical protein